MPHSPELRQQIDDLALRLVVGEPEGAAPDVPFWVAALERIRDAALSEQAPEVAEAAGALLATDIGGAELQEGIVRLQQALEAENEKPPIAAEAPGREETAEAATGRPVPPRQPKAARRREARADPARRPDTLRPPKATQDYGAAPETDASAKLEGSALEGAVVADARSQPEPAGSRGAAQQPEWDAELLGDFVLESREHLANIETQVLTLERDPADAEALNAVFRGFHTIKGLAGFLKLWEMQKVAHEVETVLDRARDSQWTITPPAIDVVLESADYLRRWLAHVEAEVGNRASAAPAADEVLTARIRALASSTDAGQGPDAGRSAGLARMAAAVADTAAPEAAPEASASAKSVAAPAPAARTSSEPEPAAAKARETMAVRVDTAKLDYLADMAGEMVIAESMVRHDPELASLKSPGLQRKLAQLTRITAELQKTAMSMRLVPIGPLFRRMARLVRDLSRQFGKQVEMETEGDGIELDRTIVEELADPFMHMVRNALDHGIEPPAERIERGKNPAARLLLRARHHAGQVVIEISDDGRGLDAAKIRAKALERGLILPGGDLSENEVYNLIFQPGFTTAEQVTDVSGRGVGMDVVRKHIEKLRGRTEIRSTPGRGATFVLKLPLTLAIIDGLVVGVGQERFIVPMFAVREMFRPGPDTIWTVEHKAEMALVRGALLPVTRLYRRFRVTPRSEDPMQSVLLVAEVEGERFCMVVDDLIGKQQVVIKSLGPMFENVAGIAGGAILGDGRVGLILDPDRLLKGKNG